MARTPSNKTKQTSQYIDNLSFDQEFEVSVVEALGYDGTNLTRIKTDANGIVQVAGDGAILDGVTSTIKASVLNYTNSKPVAVRLTDTSGDYVSVGAGTQYADGATRGTATGTLAMVDDGTNIQSVAGTVAGLLKVDISGTAANTTAIKVDGSAVTQPVSGTFWQATQPISGTVSITANSAVNVAQINGITPLMGNGVTGTGSQRVTIASDNTAFSVNATLSAETTKIIGTINIASGQTIGIAAGTAEIGNVKNSGTFAVQATLAAGATSIGKAEDVASADADVGVPAMAIRKATPANTSTLDGDYEMLQMSTGRLWTSATIDAALPAGTNAIGKLAANSGIDIGDVDILSIAAGDNNIGNVDIVTVPAPLNLTGGGLETSALRVTIASDSTGVLSVDDNGGSLTVDGTITASNTAGDVAHDGVDSGNPVKIGAKVVTSPKGLTLPANADRTNLNADADGMLMTKHWTSHADIISERITDTAGTSTAFTNFSAVVSTYNYVTTIAVFNSSATDGYVDIRDGTAGTILFTVPAPKGGGSVITFPVPLRQPTANTALAYDVSGALSTIYLSLVGYQSKV